jgi:hypothetical protein
MAKKKVETQHPEYLPHTWQWSADRIIIQNELDAHPETKSDYAKLFDSGMFVPLARAAWGELLRLGYDWTVEDQVKLLASKQRDYGHDNIVKFGAKGVEVRLWDKIARYRNLQKRGVEPENESLADTLIDIIGYCVILMMVRNNTFTYMLDEDLF